jgi:ATP-dependent helicase HepA
MFCVVRGDEHLGLAKIVERGQRDSLTVEYFDSPLCTKRSDIASSRIIPKPLSTNTRVYVTDSSGFWAVGRAVHDDGNGVELRLQGGRDVYAEYDEVHVRWKVPLADPTDFLALGITETPRFAISRSAFRDAYYLQRGATGGVGALLSSTIELVPHQIAVVQRVLRDPAQRYLLADEVGLGKTIEGGVIIRQAVIDNPRDHRVIVVAPNPLVSQWQEELRIRFGLGSYIDVSVFVVAKENLAEIKQLGQGITFLVVDEAHHVAAARPEVKPLYDLLRDLAQKAPNVLLLSATPVLRNEAGFLRMLHLLDPTVYRLEDEEGFRTRIVNRQSIAEAVASLDDKNILQLYPVIAQLQELLPNDTRLQQLSVAVLERIAGRLEADLPVVHALEALRAYISDTYRLTRRILRNRRTRITGLTPKRVGVERFVAIDDSRRALEATLENWRIGALAANFGRSQDAAADFSEFYWNAVHSLLGSETALGERCSTRLAALEAGNSTKTFDGETEYLEELARLAGNNDQFVERKLDLLVEIVKIRGEQGAKLVVFCSLPDNAESICRRLGMDLPKIVTRRHRGDGETSALVAEFLEAPGSAVLVCDSGAEEGLNLQGGNKILVNFDLPMDPNRIEQRLGRIDRYGSGDAIKSIVIMGDAVLESAWLTVLARGLRIFEMSVSSLQYLIEDQLQRLRKVLFFEGVESLVDLADKLGGHDGMAATELRLIDQQDALDELEPTSEEAIAGIQSADDDWASIRDATDHWAVDTLMFDRSAEQRTGGNRLAPPFRFRYVAPGGRNATLIPLSGFLNDFMGALDFDAPGGGVNRPLSYPYSYRRQTAIRQKVRTLRYGSEFVEALKSFADFDDRGRSFAIWRTVVPDGMETSLGVYYQFCFVVDGAIEEGWNVKSSARQSLGKNTADLENAVRRRIDSVFPPFVFQFWLDEEARIVGPEFAARFLTLNLEPNTRWIDVNLRASRLSMALRSPTEVFQNWKERCARMRESALKHLLHHDQLRHAIDAGKVAAASDQAMRVAYFRSRFLHLRGTELASEEAALENELFVCAGVAAAIARPRIRIDVVGAVILSNEPCPSIDELPLSA